METLVTVHSVLRWLVLAALLGGATYALVGGAREDHFSDRPFVFLAIVVDVQVAIGIALYLLGDGFRQGFFIAVIHPLAMLVALAAVHIGVSRARGHGGLGAFRTVGASWLFALVVVALGIPWQR